MHLGHSTNQTKEAGACFGGAASSQSLGQKPSPVPAESASRTYFHAIRKDPDLPHIQNAQGRIDQYLVNFAVDDLEVLLNQMSRSGNNSRPGTRLEISRPRSRHCRSRGGWERLGSSAANASRTQATSPKQASDTSLCQGSMTVPPVQRQSVPLPSLSDSRSTSCAQDRHAGHSKPTGDNCKRAFASSPHWTQRGVREPRPAQTVSKDLSDSNRAAEANRAVASSGLLPKLPTAGADNCEALPGKPPSSALASLTSSVANQSEKCFGPRPATGSSLAALCGALDKQAATAPAATKTPRGCGPSLSSLCTPSSARGNQVHMRASMAASSMLKHGSQMKVKSPSMLQH